MKKSLLPLTVKERSVLEFIENELREKGISPSYQEICDHFGFASFNSVQNYLKQLSNKGYIETSQNQKRAINILHSAKEFHKNLEDRLSSKETEPNTTAIPFLGRVAAGSPIERYAENEFLNVPTDFIKSVGSYFALKVEGDSMIDEGIFDGDHLIVLSQKNAKDGDLVVASVEQESTVKRFYNRKNPTSTAAEKQIELRPANPRLKSMWYHPQLVEIRGLVKGLLRKY